MTDVKVGVVMGSDSDWHVMRQAVEMLEFFGVSHEKSVVSAHRMPDDMFKYAEQAGPRGLSCIIAGAGGATHSIPLFKCPKEFQWLHSPLVRQELQTQRYSQWLC